MKSYLLAKLGGKNGEICKVLSFSGELFEIPNLAAVHEFQTCYKLDDDEFFKLTDFSKLGYRNPLVQATFSSTSYSQLPVARYKDVVYFACRQGHCFFFQKMLRSQILRKRWFRIADAPTVELGEDVIILNPHFDAIYDGEKDVLYFRDFPRLKVFFAGIEELFIEATDDEVKGFLSRSFISLESGFSVSHVKSSNRKRIAMALSQIASWDAVQEKQLVKYLKDYCPELRIVKRSFIVDSEEHLKKILFGIDERYYTTHVRKEKRLANSIQKIG